MSSKSSSRQQENTNKFCACNKNYHHLIVKYDVLKISSGTPHKLINNEYERVSGVFRIPRRGRGRKLLKILPNIF